MGGLDSGRRAVSRDNQDNDLTFRVVQLRNDVDDLGVAIDQLPQRLNGLNGSLDEVRVALRQVQTRSVDIEATSHQLTALVKRLDARVEWLERNIRLKAAAAEAQLDDVDLDERDLAQVAEAGHVARSELLSPAGRSALQAAVAAHAEAARAEGLLREAALAACETLAVTDIDDELHVAAAADLRSAVAARAAALARLRDLADPAAAAVNELRTMTDSRSPWPMCWPKASGPGWRCRGDCARGWPMPWVRGHCCRLGSPPSLVRSLPLTTPDHGWTSLRACWPTESPTA